MTTASGPERRPDRHNGLIAASYSWLRAVDTREIASLLRAMEQAQIACYTAIPDTDSGSGPTRDVYVDDSKRAAAEAVADEAHHAYTRHRIDLDPQEVDDRFAEMVALFDGPSNVPDPATDDSSADDQRSTDPRPALAPDPSEPLQAWRQSDGDWLAEIEDEDEEGYEPPPPDPMPRPTSKVVIGILLLIAGCISLFSPAILPIPLTASIAIGVALIGGGVGYLLMQLRDRPDNPFDDGARV